MSNLTPILNYIGSVLIAIVVIILLIGLYGVVTGKFDILDKIAVDSSARGLITFTFTITTVGVAIILLLSLFVTSGDKEEISQKFAQGKEIYVSLIGIFGTILGFYFGAIQQQDTIQLNVVTPDIKIAPDKKSLNLTTFVSKGEPPYTYTIIFDPKLAENVSGKTNNDGWINQKIDVTPDLNKKYKFIIIITDNKNKSLVYKSPNEIDLNSQTLSPSP